jgi:hypothetical protein
MIGHFLPFGAAQADCRTFLLLGAAQTIGWLSIQLALSSTHFKYLNILFYHLNSQEI